MFQIFLNVRCVGPERKVVKVNPLQSTRHRLGLKSAMGLPQIGCVKPGDHPEFFHFPAPEGASRESTIRLDSEGRFFHEGNLVEHPKLAAAMHTWIRRHPDDGRFILSNGYDWTYFSVEDAPFSVKHVSPEPPADVPWLELSDGTREPWNPASTRVGPNGALYARVKMAQGDFEARFTRHAQTELAPLLVEVDGKAAVKLGEQTVVIGSGSR